MNITYERKRKQHNFSLNNDLQYTIGPGRQMVNNNNDFNMH